MAQDYLNEKKVLTPEILQAKSSHQLEIDQAVKAYNKLSEVLDPSSPIL
jgi:hypothetical protein